jgi:hypothetical protein
VQVIAYKFLASGRTGPFTGFVWPEGDWVEAPSSREGAGVHACRTSDLPFWIDDELWRVELSGPVVERETQIEARRGRLAGRVESWDARAIAEFGMHGAMRARDLAVLALGEAGLRSDTLVRARTLQQIREALEPFPALPPLAAEMLAYAHEACARALAGAAASATHMACVAAAALRGPDAFRAERTIQARWIAERCGL